MATSDSDDFESADEEVEFRDIPPKKPPTSSNWVSKSTTIDSDSDDNICVNPTAKHTSWSEEINDEKYKSQTYSKIKENISRMELNRRDRHTIDQFKQSKTAVEVDAEIQEKCDKSKNTPCDTENAALETKKTIVSQKSDDVKSSSAVDRRRTRAQKPQKLNQPSKPAGMGAKKLGAKIMPESSVQPSSEKDAGGTGDVREDINKVNEKSDRVENDWELDDVKATKILSDNFNQFYEKTWNKIGNKLLDEVDNVPEELKSNKKFKEIFRTDVTWQDLAKNDNKLSLTELTKNKKDYPTVLDKITAREEKVDEGKEIGGGSSSDGGGGWGSWGSWGVSSLLNTASMGVSTITSHVSHGLSILEESISTPDPPEPASDEQPDDSNSVDLPNSQSQESFGFSNLLSGVSSITKLVESTGTKVISGGLSTLETIGKKTMEVLQEGDPGLKKKRAFFMNENKPVLSQILREAKEKAETEQKTVEEKQHARKVHFESLFDDYQGLVHLEALEMLSKQSNMKIQQQLVALNSDQMISIQETLDEVKELCDLGDDDDDEYENSNESLNEQLKVACKELGVATSFDKLYQTWEEANKYVNDVSSPESTVANRLIFENAISTLAQFTAYCVEQFHKTGELLLIKENRSTVNEADALVQITKTLSTRIGIFASIFSKCLNDRIKTLEKIDESVDITTIFLEATNASSYIQDAFRLFIPILQVGVI